jgi:hypothetical protein
MNSSAWARLAAFMNIFPREVPAKGDIGRDGVVKEKRF